MLEYMGQVGASIASWMFFQVGQLCWWGYQKSMVASATVEEAYELQFMWEKVE